MILGIMPWISYRYIPVGVILEKDGDMAVAEEGGPLKGLEDFRAAQRIRKLLCELAENPRSLQRN